MQQIKRHFFQLSSPEKTILISLGLCFIFTFFPWFYKVSIHATPDEFGKYDQISTFFAYDGITAVMGWFFSIFILTGIATVFFSVKNIIIQNFLKKNPWFYLALTGESLFLLVLTALIYASYSLQFSRAGIEFGLILAIISNIAALFGAHFYFLQKKKIHARAAFAEQMHGSTNLKTDSLEKEADVYIKEVVEKEEITQMSLADYDKD